MNIMDSQHKLLSGEASSIKLVTLDWLNIMNQYFRTPILRRQRMNCKMNYYEI